MRGPAAPRMMSHSRRRGNPSAPGPLTDAPSRSPTASPTPRFDRRLSRLRDVPDDGRGAAALRRGARRCPRARFWEFLAYHQTHVEWAGCSLHDLIQPSFSFLVGVALPFSLASRAGARGSRAARMIGHALWRALRARRCSASSCGRSARPQTNFTFEDTLTQIGLGYPFLFLLGFRPAARPVDRAGGRSSSATGRRSRSIRCPGPDFDYRARRRAGGLAASLRRASRRTGTRTATWPGRSTAGS